MGTGELKHPSGCKTTYIPELKLLIVYPHTEVTLRKIEIKNKNCPKMNVHVKVEEGIMFIDLEKIR